MGTKTTQLFSLMSTKHATVIVIAASYRFKCRSHNWMVKCMTVDWKMQILLFTEKWIILKW